MEWYSPALFLSVGSLYVLCYVQGTFKEHAEIAREVATAAPYKEWVNSNHRLEELVSTNQYLQETQMESSQVLRLQAANGALQHMHPDCLLICQ